MVFGHFTYRDGDEEWTRLESLPTDQQEMYWRETNEYMNEGEIEDFPDLDTKCAGCQEWWPTSNIDEATGLCPNCMREIAEMSADQSTQPLLECQNCGKLFSPNELNVGQICGPCADYLGD